MKRFKKFFITLLCVFCLFGCAANRDREVACKQMTTKMFNSILAGKVSTIKSLVNDKFKDGTGFFVFENTVQSFIDENELGEEVSKALVDLCKVATKKSIKSYQIIGYEHTADYNFVFVDVNGVNFKKLYLEDYANNLPSHLESYKNGHEDEYSKLVLSEGKEQADKKIMQDGCLDYFEQINSYFDEIDQSSYRIRIVFKEENGKQKIYKTEVEF